GPCDRPPNAQHGKHHHVCATHPFCGCPHWVAHTSRFLRCVRAAATGLRTHTWQTPPPVRHPIPSVNARHRPPPLGGAYIAPFAMCASRDDRPPNAQHGKHRHVCVTHPFCGCPHWVAHTSRFLRCVRAAATGLRTH